MNPPTLDNIRNCLEGIIPSFLATCDADGTPNISEISQVQYVDSGHVALSYQFFNKTRRNLLATRAASVIVVDPTTNAQYRLSLGYKETQTSGPLFAAMHAKLAGIASYSGMQGVFHLLGSDIFEVREIESMGSVMVDMPAKANLLSAARRLSDSILDAAEPGELFDRLLQGLQDHMGIEHSMVLLSDPTSNSLFTVASHGYEQAGIGSEIAFGDGVIGVAAQEGVPIRIGQMSSEYTYNNAIRDSAERSGMDWRDQAAVPYPGLDAPLSQIALPLRHLGKTLGVFFAESLWPNAFGYDEEDALSLVLAQATPRLIVLQQDTGVAGSARRTVSALPAGPGIPVRYYNIDHSVFIGPDYLIKGVAGAIFWRLANEHSKTGRIEFTNRELRRDPTLRLPEFSENLETRLILLQRRLAERGGAVRIEKSGRGRFQFIADGVLDFQEV